MKEREIAGEKRRREDPNKSARATVHKLNPPGWKERQRTRLVASWPAVCFQVFPLITMEGEMKERRKIQFSMPSAVPIQLDPKQVEMVRTQE